MNILRFENGVRVVTAGSNGNVSYVGVLVGAGSRDDGPGRDGLAHFVEHTIFKGTTRRSSWHVSNRMESVGGELNAYTSKENIMVYTGAPAGYEERSIELIADLVENARFPESELDTERGVVLEEINSYRDNASFAVFDEFEELFFEGTPLAHNILGYEDTVRRLSSADARSFLTERFTPENMVVYCMTPGDSDKAARKVEKYFGSLRREPYRRDSFLMPDREPFDELRDRGNRQANTVLGSRVFNARDPRRYALFLLSNILGGPAMNSRLTRELREKRGLVYTVETGVSLFEEGGMFTVYFGTEPDQVEKCTAITRQELLRLAEAPMSANAFNKAKRQLCGQLLVSGDNRENCAMAMAKSLMRHGEVHDNRYSARMIEQVTAEQLLEVAQLVCSTPLSRLTLT